RPRRDHDTGLLGPAPAVDEFLHTMVSAHEEFPGIAWRVSTLRGILHDYPRSGALPQRQFLRALVGNFRARVPRHIHPDDQPILIVHEKRIDLILHGVGLGTEL